MSMPPTPRFVSIQATGAGEGYGTVCYGLTHEGEVYIWYDDTEKRYWRRLENEVKSFTVKGVRG